MIISKQEAIATGHSVYFDGVPCKRLHLSPRYVVNGGCVECIKPLNTHASITFPSGTPQGVIYLVASHILPARMADMMAEAETFLATLRATPQELAAIRTAHGVAKRKARGAFRINVRSGRYTLNMLQHAPNTKDWYYDNGWKPENIVAAGYAIWVDTATGQRVEEP